MIGLGDMAIPGLAISLMSRYDLNRQKDYFTSVVFSYALALVCCISAVIVTGLA